MHEFIPADDLVRRIEAVIRVFSVHGNRKNKNKARLKFVLRERGFEWLRDTIEENYQDILKNGGIPMPDQVPEYFGGFKSLRPPLASGDLLPVWEPSSTDFAEWRKTNVRPQKQKGYSIVAGDDAAGKPDGRPADARLS